MATGTYLSVFCFFLSISSFFYSIHVDHWVFWQPGSVTACVMNCRDCRVFESNKYLLLLLLLLLLIWCHHFNVGLLWCWMKLKVTILPCILRCVASQVSQSSHGPLA